MKKFAYVSPTAPVEALVELATGEGIELVHICVPFLETITLTPKKLTGFGKFDGIVLWSAVKAMEFQFDYEILLITETQVENEEGQYQLGIGGHLFTEAKDQRLYKRWYEQQITETRRLEAQIESIHQILDNLPRPPARSAPKTEENQWPSLYSLSTRLAAWFGSR